MKKILILDALQRSSLAATRSMGKKGFFVITADNTEHTLAGASRYSKLSLAYPSPQTETDEFVTYIKSICKQHEIDMILPMSEISCSILSKNRALFDGVAIAVADFASFDLLSDKYRLFRLAKSLDIPVPDTRFIDSIKDINVTATTLDYPVVLKPSRSRIRAKDRWIETSVAYAKSPQEVMELVSRYEYFNKYPFMIQKFIQGEGQGLFTVYHQGESVCTFAHKRLKEKPPEGGVSVLSESVLPSDTMARYAKTILDKVSWNGVAMVEFKVSQKSVPYLMEINARFWGSLQLAIDCGMDFPFYQYQTFSGQRPEPPANYETGTKLRWFFGDLDRLYLILKNRNISIRVKSREILDFLRIFQKNMSYEVLRLEDMRPFLFEIRNWIAKNILRHKIIAR